MKIPLMAVWMIAMAAVVSGTGVLSQASQQDNTQDQRILKEVRQILTSEHAFDGMSISPSVRKGVVTLDGTVGSQAAKVLATKEIQNVDGIKSVGTEIAIPKGRKPATCPVTILNAWLTRADIKEGPVFRKVRQNEVVENRRLSDRSVALILKRCVGHAGFAPEEISGHSLRAGFATSAAAAGANERDIMRHTRHKSEQMVRRYIRKGSLSEGIWSIRLDSSLTL